jgi:hypothetical protein
MSIDFAGDMKNVFLPDFGEDVVYTPRNGAPRTIKAIVRRNPPAYVGSNGQPVAPIAEIEVANSATTGISSAELDTGGDAVTVAPRIGGTARAMPVHLPQNGESHDVGATRLELY